MSARMKRARGVCRRRGRGIDRNPLLRADFIKVFADGVMEYPTQSAAMLEPYNVADGTPGQSHGRLYLDPQAMQRFIQHASAAGYNIHVHAIGDAAVRETLDAFAAARSAGVSVCTAWPTCN
jgi:predicted amidohydrolase YtcJ